MPATYYIKLTNAGLAALANAQATGTPVLISHFAVGDSNGAYYEPSESQTALVHEVWRDTVNRVYIHPNNANWAVVEALIPASDGGFDIREAGAFSANGTLLAVGKYPLTNKPAPGSGSEKDLYVRMIMQVSNAETVQQTIDQSLVLATKEYVDGRDFKESVIAATTANITLSGLQTVDGVSLAVNDRVLVKNQNTASQNGIYLVKSGAWIRDYGADNSLELTPNLFVIVEKGTANADSGWMLITDGPITVGTTGLTFKQMLGDWQPLDATLTALSGITTAADKLIYSTGADQFATTNLTEFARTILDDEDAATARATLGVSIGSQVQAYDATLAALAALTGSADKLPYFNGSETAALATLTAFARTLLDDADAAAARSTLGAAPIASPTFTGTPAVPTASGGTNTTQIASTAFVQAAITALINSSPAALDTLNELAAALGNDPNFATTVTNALALKAPIASPVFTGNPTGPTPAQFDNDTSLATTEFVKRALGSNSDLVSYSVNTSLSASHTGKLVVASSVGSITLTLPSASAVVQGSAIDFFNGAGSEITVARNVSDLIWTDTYGYSLESISVGTGETLRLVSNGSNGWIVSSGSASSKYAASFGGSLASSGYQKLPSGLIIQWGLAYAPDDSYASLTFPIAFKTACFSVTASIQQTSGASSYGSVGVGSITRTGAILFGMIGAAGYATGNAYWIAIGY